MERQVTVFGGTGFIGRHVIRRLVKRGLRVIVAARDPGRALFLKSMGDVGQIAPVACNYDRDEDITAAMRGSEVAVNLIGILFERGRQNFQALHVDFPRRLARIAAARGVRRMAHISALGADAASLAHYARSKAAGEQAVQAEFPRAVLLRPSVVFGPGDDFLNRFAAMAKYLPCLPLIGGGHTKFQPVYVGDVADAVVAALDMPEAAGRIYELGGPAIYSFRELLDYIMRATGRRRCLLNLPWGLAKFQARLLQYLPRPPLTPDQVELLKQDNIVSPGALTLTDLGISPTAMEVIAPTYLDRFRAGGRFG